MLILLHRATFGRRCAKQISILKIPSARLHANSNLKQEDKTQDSKAQDPRLSSDGDNLIEDKFALLKPEYQAPKHPIILAHGLLGFDQLHLVPGKVLPGIEYWYGITQALAAKNIEVITAAVPPSGSIENRAAKLAETIALKANGKAVNIIAHSMGYENISLGCGTLRLIGSSGLDSRYMISRLQPENVEVLSLTTVATPHRGSSFADYIFKGIGTPNIPKVYKALDFIGMETGAFEQLTQSYMADSFNPRTPDVEGIRYYSYGASMPHPHLFSLFRKPHRVIEPIEGPNDGLVSVASSRWGTYKGTLNHVSHLDLINWTNRLRWYWWSLTGRKRNFNAIAFYLSIAGKYIGALWNSGLLTTCMH